MKVLFTVHAITIRRFFRPQITVNMICILLGPGLKKARLL